MKSIYCNSYGVPLRVDLADESMLPDFANILPFATHLDCQPDSQATVFAISADETLDAISREIMIHVANFAPERVFVHAGVVGWRDRAILLPGPSFAGKSTLTAALVRAGATYYSDEYAVIDEAGWIHPYARDLQMREPGGTQQKALAVHSIAGTAGILPLRAGQVHFIHYQNGSEWNPQPLTHGRAVLEMLRHAIPVQRTPGRVMATLVRMLEGATAWQSDRGDATRTAEQLLSSLEEQHAVASFRPGDAAGPHR